MNSKFKHLIVSGCSFTHNRTEGAHVWANLLAEQTGMTVSNLAHTGAGNQHIAASIILHLERTRPDPLDTLVLVMWSGIDRTDLIVERDSYKNINHKNLEHFYDEYTEHFMVGGLGWGATEFNNYKKLLGPKSMALRAWLSYTQLSDYLRCRGYTYRYTSFTDQGYDLTAELMALNLQLDMSKWMLLDNTLGKNSILYKETHKDGHPTMIAQERWLHEHLVPELLHQGILSQ